MRSFICKLVYWIMLKLYVFILWALLPLLTMGKGILIQNVVIFDGKSEKTVRSRSDRWAGKISDARIDRCTLACLSGC